MTASFHKLFGLAAACLAFFAYSNTLALAAGKSGVFDVRAHGATGDGATLDTAAIEAAMAAAATAGGGQVYFPSGRYLSGTIRLRSGVGLHLEAGARLIGTTNLAEYSQPQIPQSMPEAKWGKWHRALLVGDSVENVAITGAGTIDGNRVFDPHGEESMRGPHTLNMVNCRGISLRDVTLVDAGNYAIFFQLSDDVEIRNVKIVGGWDGVHWRGTPERWCQNVRLLNCQFYTGDDAIAGRYWNNTLIQDCLINSSCNGIRLIGPATRLTIAHNVFRGPGEQPHRTSGAQRRTNMLSGIILQPGAWDATRGPLDEVFMADNVMEQVASPITLWIKPGNTANRVTVSGLQATGVYRAAFSAESWTDSPITNVVLRDVHVEFAGGGQATQALEKVKGPGVDARSLPAWGLYVRKVQNLTVEDARFSLATDDYRPVIHAEEVTRLTLDHFNFTHVPGVTNAFATNKVSQFLQIP